MGQLKDTSIFSREELLFLKYAQGCGKRPTLSGVMYVHKRPTTFKGESDYIWAYNKKGVKRISAYTLQELECKVKALKLPWIVNNKDNYLRALEMDKWKPKKYLNLS